MGPIGNSPSEDINHSAGNIVGHENVSSIEQNSQINCHENASSMKKQVSMKSLKQDVDDV